MIVVLTDEAEADLERRGDIARDNPVRAVTFVRELAPLRKIGGSSTLLSVTQEDQDTGVRRRPYGNYLLFYRVLETHIDVNAAQDYEAILFPDL